MCARHALLYTLFDAAVAAADALQLMPGRLPPPPPGRTVVVGAGKAAARMALAVEREWKGPLEGLVVTRYGHGEPCERIDVLEAAHPVPDAAGQEAGRRILHIMRDLGPHDLAICLLSGGGSALLEWPADGLTLQDLQSVSRALLRSGASISDINCVRKHLSLVKGGRLAEAAHPARVVTFVISDVPGNEPSVIASGPTVPDPTTFADARAVLRRYRISEPEAVVRHIGDGAEGRRDRLAGDDAIGETPKPGDGSFAEDDVVMLATSREAIDAAARAARAAGVSPIVLGYDIQGEARRVGKRHAEIALSCASGHGLTDLPCVLLSGGETTVTVTGDGCGGRNTEYLLGLAQGLAGANGISALAADTDGIDGSGENAGAILLPGALRHGLNTAVQITDALARNDAYAFFEGVDGLFFTGPTRTNVNDFRAILIEVP